MLNGDFVLKRMYKRVSTVEQNMDRQTELEKKYQPDAIYEEKLSSVSKSRPEFERMNSDLKSGDIVIVESLSRLFRSTKHLLSIMEDFEKRGIELISDKESIDTKTSHGKFMFSIFSAVAQFERDNLVERTFEGLVAAKNRGVKLGRKSIDQNILDDAFKLYGTNEYSINYICSRFNISRSTFYREKSRRINEEKVIDSPNP